TYPLWAPRGTQASSRTTVPPSAAAKLAHPNQDRITLSPRTAPVFGSTFAAPKKRVRAAIMRSSAVATDLPAVATRPAPIAPPRSVRRVSGRELSENSDTAILTADGTDAALRAARR